MNFSLGVSRELKHRREHPYAGWMCLGTILLLELICASYKYFSVLCEADTGGFHFQIAHLQPPVDSIIEPSANLGTILKDFRENQPHWISWISKCRVLDTT